MESIYFATSCYGWGKGQAIDRAIKNCIEAGPINHERGGRKRPPFVKVTRCHPDTTMNGFSVSYPPTHPPVEIGVIDYRSVKDQILALQVKEGE